MSEQRTLFGGPAELDVRGLTFWRPWGEAIVRPVPAGATAPHPKRVDNRPRAPGQRQGHHIAIHTGQTIDREGLAWINERFGYGWTEADVSPAGLILGVARVAGFVTSGERPWYFGPVWKGKPNVGWVLADVVAFDAPVPFTPRCGLGLWALPDDVLRAVRERAAHGGRHG